LGVYGQRYSAAGAPIGGEFRVNHHLGGDEFQPSVAGLGDGGFVVAWTVQTPTQTHGNIYARRYTAAGAAVSVEFLVNTFTPHAQSNPSVVGLSGGGFVIAWESKGEVPRQTHVYGQLYSLAGSPVGNEFEVNPSFSSWSGRPAVSALSDGGFLVTWYQSLYQQGEWQISVQRYTAVGAPVGGVLAVTRRLSQRNHPEPPSVAVLNDGSFVVTFVGRRVFGKRYTAAMIQAGSYRFNHDLTYNKAQQSIAPLSDGGFIATWSTSLAGGVGPGILGQRYSAPPP
jgi:hypothetical protein